MEFTLTPLTVLWFVIIAVCWIGYLSLEGFGFGTGMMLKTVAKDERERRALINSIGPHWDGNEVWLLTAGGASFAAFPEWYATWFSGMFIALVLILLCLIIRICALEWRKMINTYAWRNFWDIGHTVVCWVTPVVFGVAFGNFVQGMQLEVGRYDEAGGTFHAIPADAVGVEALADNHHYLTGGFLSLFTPFTLVAGVVVLALFFTHGALWLSIKLAGDLREKYLNIAKKSSLVSTGLAAVWALWGFFAYSSQTLAIIPLAICAVLLLAAVAMIYAGRETVAFGLHFAGIAMAVVMIFAMFFPYAMKSSIAAGYSLTLAQAAATGPTQIVMTIAACLFVPVVLAYTIWAYWVFRKRIDAGQIPEEPVGLDPKKIREFETLA